MTFANSDTAAALIYTEGKATTFLQNSHWPRVAIRSRRDMCDNHSIKITETGNIDWGKMFLL